MDRDVARSYYELQYARISQHENARIQITSTVLAASTVALGLLTLRLDSIVKAFAIVPFAVALINVFAMRFAAGSRAWVKIHQARAERVLSELEPQLLLIQQDVTVASGRSASSSDRNQLFRGANLLIMIHGSVAFCAMALGVAWIS